MLVNEQMAFLWINQLFVSLVCLNQLLPHPPLPPSTLPASSPLPPNPPPSPVTSHPPTPGVHSCSCSSPPCPQLYQSLGCIRPPLLKGPACTKEPAPPPYTPLVPMTVQLFTTQYRFIWGKAFKLFLYCDFDLFKLLSSN